MELIIAVLIALGTISANDAQTLNRSDAERILQENKISQEEYDKQAAIIGLEESDF